MVDNVNLPSAVERLSSYSKGLEQSRTMVTYTGRIEARAVQLMYHTMQVSIEHPGAH